MHGASSGNRGVCSRERTRAPLDFQVSLVERQIARLDEKLDANAYLIKQKHAVLDGSPGDLAVTRDGIGMTAGQLSHTGFAFEVRGQYSRLSEVVAKTIILQPGGFGRP